MRLGTEVTATRPAGDGVEVDLTDGGAVAGDVLLVATGRTPNGDTLALDQALSANTIFVQPQTRVRLSRRRTSRFARALKAYIQSHPPGESEVEGKENKVPSSDFTFVFHSASE